MNWGESLGNEWTNDEGDGRPTDEHEVEIILQLIEYAWRKDSSAEQI